MKRWTHLVLAASLLALPLRAFAADGEGAPVNWSSLTPAQQQTLGSFADKWAQLPPARQQALARGAQRWAQMSPQQQDSARNRFQSWKSLPEERRAQIREQYERFRPLPPDEQAAVRENFNRFRQRHPSSARRCVSAGARQRPNSAGECSSRRASAARAPGPKFDPSRSVGQRSVGFLAERCAL